MTINLKIYQNTTHEEEEQALVNSDTGETYINGDYYHEKASVKIEGFLKALESLNIAHEVEEVEIDQNHEMFKNLYFYDGSND